MSENSLNENRSEQIEPKCFVELNHVYRTKMEAFGLWRAFRPLAGLLGVFSTYGSRIFEQVPAAENAVTCFLYDHLCELQTDNPPLELDLLSLCSLPPVFFQLASMPNSRLLRGPYP
ncbi:unnamed protein product [Cochlearia groenlandica]